MKPEDKELLLKDLCARLSYGVKAQYYGSEEEMLTVDTIEAIYTQPSVEIVIGQYGLGIEDIKPYLRPMSSQNSEEREELNNVLQYQYFSDDSCMCEATDWLNAHHFDYRGLIEKGLAIEVTEENNPYV